MGFAKHVKLREEKFGSILFDTLKEKVFVSNETGKDILGLLEKGESPDNIAALLAEGYGTAPEEIKKDVDEFIKQLKENGLLG